GIGAFGGLAGIYLSFYVDVSSGATVVLFSALLFVLTLAYTSVRQRVGRIKRRLASEPPVTASSDSHTFD
ncbi:MAG: metal ABC transporter permease, partial [Chloroflexi bacterium]|nr:metal ABC transporter permease [Chloroflexota bacterium]